jgi:hypothetical protein
MQLPVEYKAVFRIHGVVGKEVHRTVARNANYSTLVHTLTMNPAPMPV